MPHVNDARRLAECARLLGGPARLERAARSGGRRIIDTAIPGQQEFQALLAWALLSPRRSLEWDAHPGRAFADLESYYTWVSPQPRHLAAGWTVAARVARYLLPGLVTDYDARPRCAGIPGLRLEGTARGIIRLAHLPTGGILDLHDYGRTSPAAMRENLRRDFCYRDEDQAAHDADMLLWQHPGLSDAETAALAGGSMLRPHAPVLSAAMARIRMLWAHWPTGAELDMSPAGIPRLSWWAGPRTRDIARLLAISPIRADDAAWSFGPGRSIVITGGASLQLRGPFDTLLDNPASGGRDPVRHLVPEPA